MIYWVVLDGMQKLIMQDLLNPNTTNKLFDIQWIYLNK